MKKAYKIFLFTLLLIMLIIILFTSYVAGTEINKSSIMDKLVFIDARDTPIQDLENDSITWGHVLLPPEYEPILFGEKELRFKGEDGIEYSLQIQLDLNGEKIPIGFQYTPNIYSGQEIGRIIAGEVASDDMMYQDYMPISFVVNDSRVTNLNIAGNIYTTELKKVNEDGSTETVDTETKEYDNSYISEGEEKELERIDFEKSKAGWTESWLTRIFMGIGDLLLRLFKAIFGKDLTIDNIIFNEYGPTIIDIFGTKGTFNTVIKKVVNNWFGIFRNLALAVFLLVFIYMGIKVMITATGTPEQKKYKTFIEDWLKGILILFFMPYFLKYIIDINNTVVSILGKDRIPLLTYYNTDVEFDFTRDGTPGEDPRTDKIIELTEAYKIAVKEAESKASELEEAREATQEALQLVTKIEGVATRGTLEDAIRKLKSGYKLSDLDIPERDAIDDARILYSEMGYGEVDTTVISNIIEMYDDIQKRLDDARSDSLAKKKVYDEAIAKANELEEQIAIAESAKDTDVIGQMAKDAGITQRFVYAIVFYILLFQMVFLIILYYKRMFMVAALIIVFPLVMITYALDKMGDGKAQTLGSWMKEFTFNITVQIFHAITYIILVEAGIRIYVASGHENWLFFVLAIAMMFPIERIMRSVFGIKASTLRELNNSVSKGIAAYAAVKTVRGSLRDGKTEEEKKKETKAKKKKEERQDRGDERRQKRYDVRQKEQAVRAERMRHDRARRALYEAQNAAARVADKGHNTGKKLRALKRKAISKYGKFASSGVGKFTLGTGKILRKGVGVAHGTAAAFAAGGEVSDFVTGATVAQTIGGFSGKAGDNVLRTPKRGSNGGSTSNTPSPVQRAFAERGRKPEVGTAGRTHAGTGNTNPRLRGGSSSNPGRSSNTQTDVNIDRNINIRENNQDKV